ncbi:MAG: hypothetical protein HQK77_00975 [Desulfobacterales bacterium]|nr:hypothetical protein [Desulfobacterales bacterium]
MIKSMLTIGLRAALTLTCVFAFVCIDKSVDGFEIKPFLFWSAPQQKHALEVTGGIAPYRWQCYTGSITSIDQEHYMYQAPRHYGMDWILFEDRSGQQAKMEVNVLRPLTISPYNTSLFINDKGVFRVSGGSGQWKVMPHDGFQIQQETNQHQFTLKPIRELKNTQIQVQDLHTKEIVDLKIEVYGKLNIEKKQ